jgi:hypothetical protein
MERQAKDGTFYRQVGQDDWEPVTRQAKDGTVYKKIGADDWEPIEMPGPKEESMGDQARAFAEGIADSSTLGTLPYIKAGVDKALDSKSDTQKNLESQGFTFPADETFSQKVDRARQQGKETKALSPSNALAGEMMGFIVPGAGISKVVGKAAQYIPKAVQTARVLSNPLVRESAKLATEGAILGGAYTPESGFTDLEARGKGALVGAATGALAPSALKVGGGVLKGIGWTATQVAKAPVYLARKMLSSMGGVSDDVIQRYLENPGRIRGAETFDDLYEQVTKVVSQMGDDLDNAKVDYDTAQKHLDEIADGIKNSRVDGKDRTLELVRVAKSQLDESFKSSKESLKQQASPANIEPQVSDAIGKLKNQVTQGSKESFEILGDELAPTEVMKLIPGRINELAQRGSDAAKQAIPKLKEYGEKIFKAGQTDEAGNFLLPAKEIKRFIQDLDSDVGAWQKATGSFDDAYTKELKGLRSSLDEQLKASNETYKQQMIGVAEDTRLLSEASKRFGEPGRAVSRMSNLAKPSAKVDQETLLNLAKREGQDLTDSVNKMTSAQRTLQSPTRMDAVKSALPEAQALRQAEMQAASAKRLAKPRNVQEAIENSAASFKAKTAAEKLKAQKELFAQFKTWGEQGAESKLQQVSRGKKYATQQLEELSKLSDKDFVAAVSAAKDAAAFEKTMFNGSRNVNLWGMLGALGQSATGRAGAGAAAGGIMGGPIGIAVGGVMGAMVDNYGPRVTKKILDGVLAIKGPITESAIVNMKIPPKVKLELVKQFKSALVAERAGAASKDISTKLVAKREQEAKGKDKWANDGFEKLKQNSDAEKLQKYERMKEAIFSSKKGKDLLSQISTLPPGSKAYENAVKQLEQLQGAE